MGLIYCLKTKPTNMVQQKQFVIVSKDYADWKRARKVLQRGYTDSEEYETANDKIWDYSAELMVGNKTKGYEKEWMLQWATDCDMVWDRVYRKFMPKEDRCEGCHQHWGSGTCTCEWCDYCGCRTSNGGQGCTCE